MLTEFNTGGSHEQNPIGGIPQGQDSKGNLNTVEQGETKKDNFVYSNRLYINEDLAKKMNLPNYIKGKSFANASKSINDKFKDRNDIHSKATQKELLDRLAQSQEQLKAQEEAINQSMQQNQSQVEFPEESIDANQTSQMQDLQSQGFLPQENQMAYGGKINKYFLGDEIDIVDPNKKNKFDYKSFTNFSGGIGDMLNQNNQYSKSIQKANKAGFNDEQNVLNENLNQMHDGVMDATASAFGPVGNAIRAGQKLGEGIGSAIGGDGGAVVSGIFNPTKGIMAALTDKDASIGDKALSFIPGVGGLTAMNRSEKRLDNFKRNKLRKDNFFKYQFNENNNDTKVFAKGGLLNTDPNKLLFNPLKSSIPLHSKITDDPSYKKYKDYQGEISFNPIKNMLPFSMKEDAPDYKQNKTLETALTIEDKPSNIINKSDYTIEDIKKWEKDYDESHPRKLSILEKSKKIFSDLNNSNKLNDIMRYAPIAGNIFQKNNMGAVEVENAIKNKYQYKPQYIDDNIYKTIAQQESNNTINALNKSGISGNQLTAAMLASQSNRIKSVSDGAIASKMHNINENKLIEQVKQQNEGDYINDVRRINDVNAQNRSNYDTQKSKFNSEIFNSLGEIGKEKLYEKQAEKLTGYDEMGEYLAKDPKYKPLFDAIDNDKSLNDNQKWAKKTIIKAKALGATEEDLKFMKEQLDETNDFGENKKAYGGYMSPKFNKY
jgi:hypothetical protein